MIFKLKFLFVVSVVFGFFFSFNFVLGATTINSFVINPKSITGQATLKYDWAVTSNRNVCGGGPLYWSIERVSSQIAPDRKVAKSGEINADQFLLNSGAVVNSGTFLFSLWSGMTSEPLQLILGCVRPLQGQPSPVEKSKVVTINSSATDTGQLQIRFDANPKKVAPSSSINFNFKLSLTAKSSDLDCRNGAPVAWEVYMFPAGQSDQEGFVSSKKIQEGAVDVSKFGSSPTTINQDFSKILTTLNQDFVFKARVTCDRLGSDELTKSAAVPISAGGFSGGSGCGTPGQPDCKAGETQEYFFEIPNPLKGGANDFAGLVKIIAQWIFNLAIPIAVAMIVYAGILFLTSAGDTSKVTKAKQVLTYAVVGLAIILIGNGFVTLIQSILKLGGTEQETQQEPGAPEGPGEDYGPPAPGAVGNKCSRNRDCFSGLKCKNTICQRPTGNLAGEPCNGGASCDVGLACDATSDGQQVIDGQTLGTCFETAANDGRIGDVCQKDSNCISGLKCNQICQRKDGNLNDESCLKTSNPSNCKSTACKTVGTVTEGTCVDNSVSNPESPIQQYQNNLIIRGLEVNLGAPVNQPHRVELEIENPFSASQIYNWAVVSGSIPPGMVLTPSSVATAGQISGTATRVGSYDVTIQAMDITHKQYGRYSIQIHIR